MRSSNLPSAALIGFLSLFNAASALLCCTPSLEEASAYQLPNCTKRDGRVVGGMSRDTPMDILNATRGWKITVSDGRFQVDHDNYKNVASGTVDKEAAILTVLGDNLYEANKKIPTDDQIELEWLQKAVLIEERISRSDLKELRWVKILPDSSIMKVLQDAKTKRGVQDFTIRMDPASTDDDRDLYLDILTSDLGRIVRNFVIIHAVRGPLGYRVHGTQENPELDAIFHWASDGR